MSIEPLSRPQERAAGGGPRERITGALSFGFSRRALNAAERKLEEELAARMRAAGFAEVRWTSLSFGVAAIHVGEKTA